MKTSKLLLLAATLVLLSIPAAAQVNDTYVIPAAANVNGAFGTRWMTSFSVFNPQLDHLLTISVTYVPTGGAQGIEKLFDLPPNAVAYFDNVLHDVFGVEGTGSLLIATFPEDNPDVPDDVLARAFLVTSNTYNNARTGTYGQTIPGTWTGLLDYDSDGISSVAHGITNSSRLGWRTNVGAVNLGRGSVRVLVNVYDADGNKILNQAPLNVPPLGHFQDALPVQVEAGTIEFFVEDSRANDPNDYAVVFPYVSTIDQLSGDPTYQQPTLLASPSVLFAKGIKVDPTSIGKKIDSSYARGVRAHALRLGTAVLVRGEKGWTLK